VPSIRAATSADLPALSVYLAERMGDGGTPARFQRFFEYAWPLGTDDKPDLGVMIEHDGRVRGFIGAIYGRRLIDGREHKLCNINSWCVDEEMRTHSLMMLKRLLDRKDHDFTCVSPSDRVIEILRFLKFETLETTKVLFFPLSGVPLSKATRRVRVYDRATGIEARLDDEQRRIYRDHSPYHLAQWVIEREGRRCYVVMGKRGRGLRVFADVLHVSDPQLFSETIGLLTARLLAALGTFIVGLDQRFVAASRPARTVRYGGLRTTLFRSRSLNATDLDGLYTELAPILG
jgi:hypothetical protein